jgi:hypothetical protein
VGTAIGALVLLIAIFSPGPLGNAYRAYRAPIADDVTIRVVPFPAHNADRDLTSPDWLDASRASLAQGRLRVEIASVTVGPVQIKDPSSGRPTISKEKYLIVRLRVHRTKTGEEFAAGVRGAKDDRTEAARVTVTDNTGKQYVQPALDLDLTRTGAPLGAGGFPSAVTDVINVYEAPADQVQFLHVEVDVSAWGGKGVFYFTIPKAMILIDTPRGARDRDFLR